MGDSDHDMTDAFFDASSDAIVMVDEAGIIRRANASCASLLGYSPGTLEGQQVEVLVPARFAGHHKEHRERYASDARPRGMGTGLELVARHADGHDVPVDVALTPVHTAGRRWVAAALRDMRGRGYSGETLRVQGTALRSAANGIVITDRTGIITWVNPAACQITGYEVDELIGHHSRLLKSGQHPREFYEQLWTTVLRGDTWSGTIVNRRKDGTLYQEEQTIAPVVDEQGKVSHFIAIKQDVTDRNRAIEALAAAKQELAARVVEIETLNRRLREEAIRDPLTGLFNRRYFHETLAREVALAERNRHPICVLTLDLDHFKDVNDAHGHAAGDRTLVALARLLDTNTRASDIACRFGGEEFVVVLPGVTLEVARQRAEAVRRDFAAIPLDADDGGVFHVTLSVGVAAHAVGEESIERTLARADGALYDAKHAGRDRVVVADRGAGFSMPPRSRHPLSVR